MKKIFILSLIMSVLCCSTSFAGVNNAMFFQLAEADSAAVGKIISFQGETLDGETLTSQQLFAANKITMVNLWGTWCPFCVDELDDLAQLHYRLQEKGCGIIGVEVEGDNFSRDDAKSLLQDKGVTYPSVLVDSKSAEFFKFVDAYPTTFFVDSRGRILTTPIEGAAVDEYEPTLDNLLAKFGFTPNSNIILAMDNSNNNNNLYRVYVKDSEGQPVKNVTLQFCDDKSCDLENTDENGLAEFDNAKEGKIYDIHVLKVPAGYKPDKNTYKTTEKYGDIVITLTK